jgi:hypothetical protein
MKTTQRLLLTVIMTTLGIYSYAQNVLPTSGNVGIGTVSPESSLDVKGCSKMDTVIIRESLTAEKPVYMRDSVTIERTLKIEENIEVLGDANFHSDLRIDGSVNLNNYAGQSLEENFLFVKDDGSLDVKEKSGLLDFLYEPRLCIVKPDGNYFAPTWGTIDGINNEPGILFTANDCPGNVGIGTNAPLGKLDVRGNVFIGGGQTANGSMLSVRQVGPDKNGLDVILTSSAPNLTGIGINTIVDKDGRKALNVHNAESNLDVFSVQGDGKVTISGTSQHSLVIETNNFNNACIAFHAQSEQSDLLFFDLNNQLRGVFRHYIENGKSVYTWDDRSGGNYNQLMKLSSDGSLYAHEINVKTGTFPDYVFKDGYQLMKIEELETFIKQYGHLPNMPKEAEVLENGLSVGEMEVKLVEKVEELTLYIIELEKKYNELLKRIESK